MKIIDQKSDILLETILIPKEKFCTVDAVIKYHHTVAALLKWGIVEISECTVVSGEFHVKGVSKILHPHG